MLKIENINVGEEYSVLDLDNLMKNEGHYSEYDSFTDELLESGSVVYTNKETEETTTIRFDVTEMHGEDESSQASYIKVTDMF